jgi:hypothetical protein
MRVSELGDGVRPPSDAPEMPLIGMRNKARESQEVCLTHPLEPSKFNGLAYTGDDVATKGGSRICRK